jgi:4-amino-4-deoxy-L-arabinose transferase-like glycosyltransferase
LAGFLRLWNLSTLAPSLYWDEVSQGYNAYSIATTGRDEHGEFLPLARFQAFGDYKAPVYTYFTVPSIFLFGKTDFAVRFPSAFFGTLTVLMTYFLAKSVFASQKKNAWIGLGAAFLLAISPWHIQLSRTAYEGNIATYFTVTALALFFIGLRKLPYFFSLSIISFVIGFYSFNAHRVFIPLIVLLLALLYRKELFAAKKYVISGIAIGLIFLIPFFIFFLTPESRLRFQEVNIFSDPKVVELSNELRRADNGTLFGNIIHNRRVLYAKEYLENYFDFYNPSFLFFKGDPNPRFSDQVDGQLYLFILPLLILGLYYLTTIPIKERIFLIGWFLLAPVAAATAKETPHALRSETFLPTFQLFSSLGLVIVLSYLQKKRQVLFSSGLALFLLISLLSLLRFWHNYSIHMPYLYSQDWQYGYKMVIEKTSERESQYDKIYFTDAYGRAYIYVAWYGDVSPNEFRQEVSTQKDTFGFYNVDRLGKYFFNNNPKAEEGKVLYVTTPDAKPEGTKTIDEVHFLNGKKAFVLSENSYEE